MPDAMILGPLTSYVRETYLPLAGLELGRNAVAGSLVEARHIRPGVFKLIVAQGETWTQLFSDLPLSDWRGFSSALSPSSTPIFCALTPGEKPYTPYMELPTRLDWRKVGRFISGTWPATVPPCLVADNDNEIEVWDWFCEARKSNAVVIDTETTRGDNKRLLLIGMGYEKNGQYKGLQFPWSDRSLHGYLRQQFITELYGLVSNVPTVFHNAVFDMPVLRDTLHIPLHAYYQVQDTMLAHHSLWCEWPHDLGFLASLYGQYGKLKHLSEENPFLYNWGDVLATLDSWAQLKKELTNDKDCLREYTEQKLPLIPIQIYAHEIGCKIDKAFVEPAYSTYTRKKVECERIAHASAGWPINLGSNAQLQTYLYKERGYPVQRKRRTKKVTTDGDAIAVLRNHVGPAFDPDTEEKGIDIDYLIERIGFDADPILEARVLYGDAAKNLSNYIVPAKSSIRWHPTFSTHTQTSGRWSITAPPMATLPADLRGIVCPDVGTAWIEWDWDQIELRMNAALSGDKPSIEAFAKGWDVHTLTACEVFALDYPIDRKDPHREESCRLWRDKYAWQGKDDIRRVFCKRFVYRLDYGGKPEHAGDIPGAKQLGLTPHKLIRASEAYLAAHPAKAAFRRRIIEEVKRTKTVRDFMGCRRKLLGTGNKIYREAVNHPMQRGVSTIANYTVLAVQKALPYAVFKYSMHDSQKWAVPEEKVEEALRIIEPIVTREWTINGVSVKFPATFKVRRLAA